MKKNLIYLLFICLSFAGCEDEEMEYDLGTVFDVSDVEVIIADTGVVVHFGAPLISNSATQNLDRTGYRQRKHYTYDYAQSVGDELLIGQVVDTNSAWLF